MEITSRKLVNNEQSGTCRNEKNLPENHNEIINKQKLC